jgi:hypothetical protein
MARETINIGVVANDGTGDSFRIAGQKINNNFAELYITFEPTELGDGIELTGNDIVATRSNDNINIIPSGTGIVTVPSLRTGGTITFADNVISTVGNSDINLMASGTGSVVIDSVSLSDNTISTNTSNADLQLITAGTGKISINGLALPRADNGAVQVVKTDAAGTLSFVNVDFLYLFAATILTDGTVTLSASATANVDTFDSTVFRSVRYVMSITDATNSRYEILEAVITHDGSTAYVNDYGSTTNHTGSLVTLTADFSGSDVRLRATPISSDSTVIRFLATRQVI